jgi:hypothetical protein
VEFEAAPRHRNFDSRHRANPEALKFGAKTLNPFNGLMIRERSK